ncbi:MAG: acyl-[acyl-carrier-protein]--UDP-N-acetylglucosamine O-acyltransferase [Deltaproteobacteria bacterium RBG_13_53_10]|nr:MAG: acyl-[acyl-carrier-protein]--UDP-N-acetylglucosamine O-acyltransferase [Deltaproteobacteria bacterium RBG_13_53_10]
MIHSTAIVDSNAEIGEGVDIGPYSVVEGGVSIGEGTKIGPHVIIREGTRIGKRCQIFQFASIGEAPQFLGYKGEKTFLQIGDHNVIREFVTLHRGTVKGGGKTAVGNDNFFMAYSHVAHDCQIGNQVVLANGAALGGHILIEDYATIGGLSAVHQFCQIGTHAFVSGLTGVPLDIPPYMLAAGNRARLYGLNTVGLKRHKFPEETVRVLKKAYRTIFRSGLALEKALQKIREDEIPPCPEVRHLLDFIQRSKRGISR